jgi:hypothetical protein
VKLSPDEHRTGQVGSGEIDELGAQMWQHRPVHRLNVVMVVLVVMVTSHFREG